MLVLTRRGGEQIILPTLNITVTVLEVVAGRVRIGITAPPEIKIVRSELLDRAPKPEVTESASGS